MDTGSHGRRLEKSLKIILAAAQTIFFVCVAAFFRACVDTIIESSRLNANVRDVCNNHVEILLQQIQRGTFFRDPF